MTQKICDCVLSQNGLGMAGRECDCPAFTLPPTGDLGALERARLILAHTDIGSLPNDWTLEQIAEARIDDLLKLRDQVRDTCRRAEAAEARIAELEREHKAELLRIHTDIQLPKGWLTDEFSRVDADVAQWSVGMKDSFKEATGIAIPPAPTPSKGGDDAV
jgi:hypothetical protein